MNKRHGIIAVALVALLLATSCSTFFTGGVSGKVKYNGEPVARATVALYFDEGQRNADFDAGCKTFNTQYKTETQENGSFAITNIPWDDAFPEFGKDADSKTAYAIIYHEDYEPEKVDGITVISGRSNEIFPEFDKKIAHTKRININFKQVVNDLPAAGITHFKYSYSGRPGYGTDLYKGEADVTNGTAVINMKYVGDSVPKINIYDIQASEYDREGKAFTLTVNSERKAQDKFDDLDASSGTITIDTVPYKYRFPGFDGVVKHIVSSSGNNVVTPYDTSVSVVIKDAAGKVVDKIFTYGASDRFERYENFRGLGNEIVLKNEPVDGVYASEIKNEYTIEVDGIACTEKFDVTSDSTVSRDIVVTIIETVTTP